MNWIEYEIPRLAPREQVIIRLLLEGKKCGEIERLTEWSEKELRAIMASLRQKLLLPALTPGNISNGKFFRLHGEGKPLRPLPTMDDPMF